VTENIAGVSLPSLLIVPGERADDVQRMSKSHSPFLSQPAELARLIRRYLACKRN
jgi:hypothetical protein